MNYEDIENNPLLSDLIKKRIKLILSGTVEQDGLINLRKNIVEKKDSLVTEYEKEMVDSALETQLRTRFPRKAKSVFGPKDMEAREMLETSLKEMKSKYDYITNNQVGSHVKTGGAQISGEYYIWVYISYKNLDGWNTALEYIQEKADDEPTVRFRIYHKGANNPEGRIINDYKLDDYNIAKCEFDESLSKIVT